MSRHLRPSSAELPLHAPGSCKRRADPQPGPAASQRSPSATAQPQGHGLLSSCPGTAPGTQDSISAANLPLLRLLSIAPSQPGLASSAPGERS